MQTEFVVNNYDLAATLVCGQAFRWRLTPRGWEGVVAGRWVCLQPGPNRIAARAAETPPDWEWLRGYLQVDFNLTQAVATFPRDEPMRAAVEACRGLRLLRQDPWECLASFICSSNKQIMQIQQIIDVLCRRFGEPVAVPSGCEPAHAFPAVDRVAALSESELRDCKMGFRAPYLRETAQMLVGGEVSLEHLREMPLVEAREALLRLPGVGVKIANCVLLFGYGFPGAFPVDVWVMRGLRELYFPKRRVKLKRLQRFSETHFGPHAGYAQQYLFHYVRTRRRLNRPAG